MEEPVVREEDPSVSELKNRLAQTLHDRPALQNDEKAQSTTVQSAPAQIEEAEGEDGREQLRFSLQFYRIAENLAVINEVPYLGSSSTEKEMNNLLGAILRALGMELAELPAAARFNWPLSADEDASLLLAADAYQALEGFLGKRLGTNFYDVVVVFGSQCEELFANSSVSQLLGESSNQVIHTHSLDAMLKVPMLKRSVWESIRVIPKLL